MVMLVLAHSAGMEGKRYVSIYEYIYVNIEPLQLGYYGRINILQCRCIMLTRSG